MECNIRIWCQWDRGLDAIFSWSLTQAQVVLTNLHVVLFLHLTSTFKLLKQPVEPV